MPFKAEIYRVLIASRCGEAGFHPLLNVTRPEAQKPIRKSNRT